MLPRVTILGVPIDAITALEAQELLQEYLHEDGMHHVMTPNSEMLVAANKNSSFKRLLQRTALNIPDSAGLLWAARLTRQKLPERVTGVDTVEKLCSTLGPEHPVFLLGAAPGVAQQAADALTAQNPNLRIAGTFGGSPQPIDDEATCQMIDSSGARVLLVAYGAPVQDEWIDRNKSKLPDVRLAMGVGGTFDFLAGVQTRAPKLLQQLGLEWLWRLAKEPRRLKRICRAVLVFPVLVLRFGRSGRFS